MMYSGLAGIFQTTCCATGFEKSLELKNYQEVHR